MEEPMNMIAQFRGTVYQGYIGNIQYHTELEDSYTSLRIVLTHDNEHCPNPSARLLYEMRQSLHQYRPELNFEEMLPSLCKDMKTEIQLAAFLNERFIGNRHMPGTTKEIFLSPDNISPGCLNLPITKGHLRVVINFFQVLCDDTHYTLTIWAQ